MGRFKGFLPVNFPDEHNLRRYKMPSHRTLNRIIETIILFTLLFFSLNVYSGGEEIVLAPAVPCIVQDDSKVCINRDAGTAIEGHTSGSHDAIKGTNEGRITTGGQGAGVRGISKNGPGVVGVGGTDGIQGSSSSKSNSGVWGNNTGGGYGVAGSTSSANAAGGVFSNSAGDQIQAGTDLKNPVFRVSHDGDVYVRGTLIGQRGKDGVNGTNGIKGKDGKDAPVVVALCFYSSNPSNSIGACASACSAGQVVTHQSGRCIVSTGTPGQSCQWLGVDGVCCVCKK